MGLLADLLYLIVALVTAPLWLARMIRTGKIRTDWAGRFGRAGIEPPAPGAKRRVLIHAVSVGEVNAVRLLVDRLSERRRDLEIVIATTTDTGFVRARALFGDRHRVVRYPLDFTFAVRRFLRRVRPALAALVELEVWPNFTRACRRRGIPVGVINGRLTERSLRRYRRVRPLVAPSFRRLSFIAAQNGDYASRFRELGAPSERVTITGTMKWDTAEVADSIPGAEALAEALGIDRDRPLIVAGSTAPGEHELLAAAAPPEVQLLCAPRKPEWFDQAAAALPGCARRSRGERGSATGRFLLDTIGELRLAYALADIVVIGRSFGDLHGSDMMEPAALGRPVVVGPAVSDFQETVDALIEGGGLILTDRDGLPRVLRELMDDSSRRRELGERGRAVIRARQGATERTLQLLLEHLPERPDA
jgi:3-deoxy-D-manno-octulosonic-acid transferase